MTPRRGAPAGSVRFAAVGLASFALDCLLLWLVQSVSGSLLVAVIVARIVSGTANFTANRLFVFNARHIPWQEAARRYVALAAVLLVANYVLIKVLTAVGVPTVVAKVITEVSLFCISFVVQRLVVFARRHGRHPGPVGGTDAPDDVAEIDMAQEPALREGSPRGRSLVRDPAFV